MFFRWTLSVLEQSYKRNQITKSPRGAQGSLAATPFGHLIADKKVGAAGPSFGPFLAPLGPLRASLAALPLLSSAPLWAPWPSLSAFLGLLLRPLRWITFCVKVVPKTHCNFSKIHSLQEPPLRRDSLLSWTSHKIWRCLEVEANNLVLGSRGEPLKEGGNSNLALRA